MLRFIKLSSALSKLMFIKASVVALIVGGKESSPNSAKISRVYLSFYLWCMVWRFLALRVCCHRTSQECVVAGRRRRVECVSMSACVTGSRNILGRVCLNVSVCHRKPEYSACNSLCLVNVWRRPSACNSLCRVNVCRCRTSQEDSVCLIVSVCHKKAEYSACS